MPGWAWILIWIALAIFAAGYLGYIFYALLGKANRAAVEVGKVADKFNALEAELVKIPDAQQYADNLLDNPAPLAQEYARNLKKRELKRQAEQRRLINKLIEYKADESEFLP